MNIFRKVAGAVLALTLAAFAGAAGAQNVKYFDLFAPAGPIAVTTTTIDLTYKNVETGNSTFNAISAEWTTTPGVTLTVTNAKSYPANGGTYYDLPGDKIAVTDLPPTKKNQSITIRLTVQISATTCAGGTITWIGGAWTGSVASPSTAFVQNNANPTTVVSGPSCSVEFVPGYAPASAKLVSGSAQITSVTNAPAGAPVQARVLLGATVDTSFNGPITIERVVSPAGANFANHTVNAVNGVATFGPSPLPTTDTAGVYWLRPKAGTLVGSAVSILVSGADLDCAAGSVIPPGATFDASASGATDVTDPGFASGFRAENWKNTASCTLANYIATNNINGTTDVVDANGFTLPPGWFSIVYDVPPGNEVALSYTLTFKPELAGPDGLPANKAKYCKNADTTKNCNNAANVFALQGCLSPVVKLTSIPSGEPACLSGVSWSTVPLADCSASSGVCVQVTIRVTDAKDPPIAWD